MEEIKVYYIDDLLEEAKKNLCCDYSENISDYSCGSLDDTLSEIADSSVDIYNYDLLKWLSENWDVYDSKIGEIYGDSVPCDLLGNIRQAQYMQYDEELHDDFENIVEYLKYYHIKSNYNIFTITEEQKDEISCIKVDLDDDIEDLASKIDYIIKGE